MYVDKRIKSQQLKNTKLITSSINELIIKNKFYYVLYDMLFFDKLIFCQLSYTFDGICLSSLADRRRLILV